MIRIPAAATMTTNMGRADIADTTMERDTAVKISTAAPVIIRIFPLPGSGKIAVRSGVPASFKTK